jgi:hypothetical protein
MPEHGTLNKSIANKSVAGEATLGKQNAALGRWPIELNNRSPSDNISKVGH